MRFFVVTLLCGMTCHLSAAEAPANCMLPVHVQKRTTANYLYQSNMPAMAEFTMCFWLERYPEDINNQQDYLVSLAIAGNANEMMLGWGTDGLSLAIRNAGIKLPIPAGETQASLWKGWHKHCFTWEAGGFIKWFSDRTVAGKVELVTKKCATADSIRAGGLMTLLQEQDAVGGAFDINQVAVGKLAGFNMWDFEMATAAEINDASCEGTGNIASWDTLIEEGQSSDLSRPFPQCHGMLPVYVQQKTISSYLYKPDMPAMSAFTMCFWMEGYPEYHDRKDDFLVSLAIPGQDNELHMGWTGNGNLFLSVNNTGKIFSLPAGETMALLWNGWNKHCFTWKRGGHVKWYTDRAVSGKVELVASVTANAYSIQAGGHMTLLQEQDSFGGSFNINQVAVGKIAEFNMWNLEMKTAAQINSATCRKQGNVATMDQLLETGTSGFFYRNFPQCEA